MKRFVGLARVSSREQEREGFSLDVQVDAMHEYARSRNGVMVKIFRIAETATRAEQRKVFREMIAYARRHAKELDGILFYKIDRAARNLRDIVTLEEIESEHGLPFISITQPVQNTPTGKMVRRTLATMAAFQTEQQSLDIKEGVAKRVESGWFPSNPPYGYRNVRRDGKGIVEVEPLKAEIVKLIFHHRTFHELPVEGIIDKLYKSGHFYCTSKPRFTPSKVNAILHDRSYLGFVKFRGDWLPGRHEPLIDQTIWDRVQVSFGEQSYRSHDLVYGDELIECGFCGRAVTGEAKDKVTKTGPRTYTYYRCSKYRSAGHPSVRFKEQEFDGQIMDMLSDFGLRSPEAQAWAVRVAHSYRSRNRDDLPQERMKEIKRQLSRIASQKKELLRVRVSGLISDGEFEEQRSELQEREAILQSQLGLTDEASDETDAVAARAKGIFGEIIEKWASIRRPVKRRILRLLFGAFVLDETTLLASNRTPLELLRCRP